MKKNETMKSKNVKNEAFYVFYVTKTMMPFHGNSLKQENIKISVYNENLKCELHQNFVPISRIYLTKQNVILFPSVNFGSVVKWLVL